MPTLFCNVNPNTSLSVVVKITGNDFSNFFIYRSVFCLTNSRDIETVYIYLYCFYGDEFGMDINEYNNINPLYNCI